MLQLLAVGEFAEDDVVAAPQIYVACDDCCRAYRGVRQPLECGADGEALLEIRLHNTLICELCGEQWECAFPRSLTAGLEPAARADH